jgi:fructan beta-fructosidase
MQRIVFFLLIIISLTSFAQTEKTFKIDKNYLNIPIQSSVERQRINFLLDGKSFTYNDIRLAENKVDYWTFIDVSTYKGKDFTFEFSEKVDGIEKIYQSDKFVGEENLYKENLRPQIHFSTRRGWNNDPNGMVYYEGEYHLFYQHNPYEIKWGNMTWGHAVSKDLLHWEELPITLLPDELGTMFSGSAVIDYNNTSGFGKGKTPAMVAIYTSSKAGKDPKQQQCIAYSLDKGRTFTKYEGNPIIPSERKFGSGHERDPKVFYYEPGKHWVLIMHQGLNYCIYNSKDLKNWEQTCIVDAGFWECPEFFELPVDGNENNKKWIIYGVQGIYLIGNFDGKKFTPETSMLSYNIPGRMTAAQTFNDEPNGRRIQIGWGHAEFPDMPFSQTFTFPQEYSLKTTPEGIRLFIRPVKEIEELYTKSYNFANEYIGDELNNKLRDINSPLLHIKTTIKAENARQFGLNINGYKISYDVATNTLNDVFVPLKDRELELEIIVDKTLIEIYVNGGLYYWFANNNEGNLDNFKLQFEKRKNELNQDPKTMVKSLEIHELKSIW